jgi:hypothetical protein
LVGARKFTYQLAVGILRVVLTVLFEAGPGLVLDYPQSRILSDYNFAAARLDELRSNIHAICTGIGGEYARAMFRTAHD